MEEADHHLSRQLKQHTASASLDSHTLRIRKMSLDNRFAIVYMFASEIEREYGLVYLQLFRVQILIFLGEGGGGGGGGGAR